MLYRYIGDQKRERSLEDQSAYGVNALREATDQLWTAKWKSVGPTVLAPIGEVGVWARVGRIVTLVGTSVFVLGVRPAFLACRRLHKVLLAIREAEDTAQGRSK